MDEIGLMSLLGRDHHESLVADSANGPLVSVIICVYNAGEYLRPALQSILSQTYRNLDIVVIDDGSTDGCIEATEDLMADRRVRLFRQTNATRPVALNRALDLIRGEYYAVNDADDISHPERVAKQVQAFLERPHLGAVFCGHELLMDQMPMAPIFTGKSEEDCKRSIKGFHMPGHDPTGMYRLSIVGHLRYDPTLPFVEGYDYVLRVGEQFPTLVLGECLYGYRILTHSITRRDPMQREQRVTEALKRACERRGLEFARIFPSGSAVRTRSRRSARDNNLAAHFMESVLSQRHAGRRLSALKTGMQCIGLYPFDVHYHKALCYAVMPEGLIKWIRARQ